MSRTAFAFAAVIAGSLAGCGTTMNIAAPNPLGGDPHSKPPITVYGGVANDVRHLKHAVSSGGTAAPLFATLAVLDIPLSAIGDTLTLPITGTVTIWRLVDALNYMAEDHKRASIFHSEWWRFWCNGEPTPVAQLPES